MEARKYEADTIPHLDDEGKIRIVKVTVDFIEYDGYFKKGWKIDKGNGFEKVSLKKIINWTY